MTMAEIPKMVTVEMRVIAGSHSAHIQLSRVPAIGETLRVLVTEEGMTTAQWFRVIRILHACFTEQYPRPEGSIDAWADCVLVARDW